MGKRQRIEPTDDWQQLALRVQFPEQRTYELIRPVVLFAHSPAERARQTGAPERTLYRQVARFERGGMASLFGPAKVERHRTLPENVRQHILALKAEHPTFTPHEIARICQIRFDRRPSSHTIQRIIAETPPPLRATRRFSAYHEIADPAERRLAVIRLHSEGWAVKSIAMYLDTGRETVYRTLRRWVAEGVAGLEDKSHARTGVRKVDLKAIVTVKELQENPRLGEFRVHARLRQLGIFLSPRTCGRILAHNRAVYGLSGAVRRPHEPKPFPFTAQHRHQYWTVDLRYIDNDHVGGKIYCISILENYSRAILASALSRRQDLSAYLIVFYAAVRQHGSPQVLVSDSGGIFATAKQAKTIYQALGIRKEEIARRQPWQSLIEANFGVQARMADWDFGKATTWEDLLTVHDQWVADFNFQVHWAHRKREDGRHTPRDVLGWVTGREWTPEALHRIFYTTRFGRKLDRMGYVRFRHWRLYGEQGLPGKEVAVWLYRETLTVTFVDEPLAEYRGRYEPDRYHFRAITDPHLFATPFVSPQLPLFAPDETVWIKVLRLPDYAPRHSRLPHREQPRLFPDVPVADHPR
ncbi:MAG: helix-turn-helix domain-containing protein [Chloroflexota bacterium]|nr:helix-turn-helix domain-containing protein [Chloroflexota bacterium]